MHVIISLWMSKDDKKLLAANGHILQLHDATTGDRLWRWEPPNGRIRSAHFMSDGGVVVATDGDVTIVDAAGQTRSTVDLSKLDALGAGGGVLDDVIPLPGGGLAFAVIRQEVNFRPGQILKPMDLRLE